MLAARGRSCIVGGTLMASSRRLASWYFQLAQMLEAGLPLLEAVEAPGGPSPKARAVFAERLRQGAALADELAAVDWLPAPDGQLLIAGAAAGRLPDTCRRLAAHHETVAKLAGRAVLAALYPLAVVHLGAVLLPIRQLVLGSPLAYAGQVAAVLVPLWLVAAAVSVVLLRHGGVRRRVFALLPWFGGYQRARDRQVLASVLEGYVAVGWPIGDAWVAAGAATGAPRLVALARRLAAEAEAGRPPGLALLRETELPAEFAQAYRTGEQSGRLDESLAWLTRRYADEAGRKLTHASIWYPQFVLLGVALWVAVKVVGMYAGYLDSLLKIMDE